MGELIIAKFIGDEADAHRLPAYEAVQSLYGISRSLLILTNYLAEGRVRRKDFSPQGFELNIVTQREGSFETLFEIIANPAFLQILSNIGVNVGTKFLNDFLRSMFKQTVGQPSEPVIEELVRDGKIKSGDLLALSDAIEPAMRSAHLSIGRGASKIIVITGDNNTVNLDNVTKRYVNESISDPTERIKLFSVSSFNANSRDGRAFDLEEGRSIPFKLQVDADRTTVNAILESMASYARKRTFGDNLPSAVAFKYHSVLSVDQKLKKMILIKARQNLQDL